MTAAAIDRIRRKAEQGESISREDALDLIHSLPYEAKLQLRSYLRAIKNASADDVQEA